MQERSTDPKPGILIWHCQRSTVWSAPAPALPFPPVGRQEPGNSVALIGELRSISPLGHSLPACSPVGSLLQPSRQTNRAPRRGRLRRPLSSRETQLGQGQAHAPTDPRQYGTGRPLPLRSTRCILHGEDLRPEAGPPEMPLPWDWCGHPARARTARRWPRSRTE